MPSLPVSNTPRRALATILIYGATAIITLGSLVGARVYFYAFSSEGYLYIGAFLAPFLFAAAAALVTRRPAFSSLLVVLASSIPLRWTYSSETRIWVMGNSWVFFNSPDRELSWQPFWPIVLRILAVAMQAFSLTVAVFRLLPDRWRLRNSQLCSWTWPAFITSFAVLAFWFVEATTPYRIPGAMDYLDYPAFQILHIEKHGLHIQEKCVSLYDRRDRQTLSVFADDRHLFQYRFRTMSIFGAPAEDLGERVKPWTEFAGTRNSETNPIRPLRSWNAEGWYVTGGKFGFVSYTTENGRTPPPEIVALFHRFEAAAPPLQPGSQLKDVCLGFCFDPLAAMGRLYSNHRCFYDGMTVKCR